MTFLNPLVLFGLVAAAIPLLLHLLNLRKLQTIEFSTLTFLRELQQTKIRRLKLRQILLLILRTLLVISIVIAFARPALRGSLGATIGSHANSTIVLIFDDSYSMSARDEHGERFARGKEAAYRLIDLLRDGDETYLIRLSDLPRATVNPAAHDREYIRTAVRQSEISPIHRTIDAAIRLAAELLKKSHNANTEVYVISDLQATQLPAPNPLPPSLLPFGERVKFFFVQIGETPVSNVAVDSAGLLSAMIEKGKPFTISTTIRNFNAAPLQNSPVSLFLDNVRLVQHNCSVDAWGSSQLDMDVTPKQSGILRGYIECENDALEQDNRRYFTVSIPDHLRIGLITGVTTDAKFLRVALSASQGDSTGSFWDVQQQPVEKTAFLDLRNLDAVILQDFTNISAPDGHRLAQFVREGGGLIIFPSSLMPDGQVPASFTSELGLPPMTVERLSGGSEGLKFQSVDLDHPLFSGMFERTMSSADKKREIESPLISRDVNHQTGRSGQTIIEMTGGKPFLAEYRLQNGKILFYAVPPVLSWSDFPVKGLFAPLLYRSIIYTADRGDSTRSFYCGDMPAIALRQTPELTKEGRATLLHPDGSEEIVRTNQSRSAATTRPTVTMTPERLTQPGIYEIRTGQKLVTAFAVNVDPVESDSRLATSNQLTQWLSGEGIATGSATFLHEGTEIQARVVQSRYGVELWRYCIVLALLLAIAEMIIARDSKKAVESAEG